MHISEVFWAILTKLSGYYGQRNSNMSKDKLTFLSSRNGDMSKKTGFSVITRTFFWDRHFNFLCKILSYIPIWHPKLKSFIKKLQTQPELQRVTFVTLFLDHPVLSDHHQCNNLQHNLRFPQFFNLMCCK